MLCQPDTYVPQNWHVTLLYWAIIAFCVFINIAAGWLLPKFEGALLVLHILGFFAILIPLLVLGPQGNARETFTTFVNMGHWQTQGLSFCIGIMGSVFAFVGGDGPIHVSVFLHEITSSIWLRSKTLTNHRSYLRRFKTHRSSYLAPS